ncbi:hypothetical protein [Azospirillum isscasi]|uniref:Transposase n=1 Tax=Azospirillum isscasi TaxID=3053926 RepID=A0ABU0WMR2_9PROT|nr:hypothetical protein [Azospirillum isscasi]MDQ2105525.1 hypothetical protein [Azospirillum isscasi]
MFQLDREKLDVGIDRIMNRHRGGILPFLRDKLPARANPPAFCCSSAGAARNKVSLTKHGMRGLEPCCDWARRSGIMDGTPW